METLEHRRVLAAGLVGEYFNDIQLTSLAQTRIDPIINFLGDWGNAPPGTSVIADDNYSERWTGFVHLEQPGDWTFYTTSNDGVRLWVDGTQIIDHWDQHSVVEDIATVNKAAGWYPIQLEHFQQNGTAEITLSFSGPGQSKSIIPETHLNTESPAAGIPVADAGPDKTVILPTSSVTLNGSGTDDGTIVSYQWQQVSGPSTASLSGASTPNLTAGSLVNGNYTFSLTVTDDQSNTDTDTADVTVITSGGGGTVTGELKKWHKATITFDGPNTSETATPNPFTDYRLNVTFSHPGTGRTYEVPGYYAADGDAANTSATSGNKWRVHFAPSEEGTWNWVASFRAGTNIAASDSPTFGSSAGFFDGAAGQFSVAATDKDPDGRDFRGKGLLEYVGGHYLQFAETGDYFLKQGADSPENFLAYGDFDGPFANDGQNDHLVKSWAPHVQDWNPGDPSWAGGKGRGIIGAVNYLASEGQNAFSFKTMNINGDDRNVFPYLDYNERLRMDVSRLDQWEMVFEHADQQGMFLHFKTQETENELLLDGGDLGVERRVYYRELIARFSHHLALNWNLGEEINNATTAQKQSWAQYFHDRDPYQHHIVIHNGDNHYDLLGSASQLTGFSLQTSQPDFSQVHTRVREYLDLSATAGKPWAVAADEPGDAANAIRPDSNPGNSHEDGRKNALWGTLLAGGWGNEWYFGYLHPNSDLTLTDFRSRDGWWDYTRYALEFFEDNAIPFWEMQNDNSLSSATNDYAMGKAGEVYVVYLKDGGTTNLDLSGAEGAFDVEWYDPRSGGALQSGTVSQVSGGGSVSLGQAPHSTSEDWAILISPASTQSPFSGSVPTVTDGTRIQAEDFDIGGPGFAYSDTTPANVGGAYRPAEGVDIQATTDAGGGFNVGWIADAEFLEYTVNISPGDYDIHARVASARPAPGDLRLLIGDGPDGTNFTEIGVYPVESTGAWQSWTTLTLNDVDLSPYAGNGKVLRLEMVGDLFNVNWIEFDQSNAAPVVDAGPDQALELPDNDAFLNASVSDDGSPNPPGSLTTTWTKVFGGGTVSFADPTAVDTTATFSEPGVYTLRLTADDGAQTTSDDVVVTVTSPSQTVVVDATDDAYLQNGANLNNSLLKVENGSSRVRTSYLKFGVTGMSGFDVTSASLQLFVDTDAGSGTLVAAAGSHNAWDEATLSPATAPVSVGTVDTASGAFGVGQLVSFDVTSVVSGDGEFTFILDLLPGGNDVWFGSSESSTPPQLVIDRVLSAASSAPEPFFAPALASLPAAPVTPSTSQPQGAGEEQVTSDFEQGDENRFRRQVAANRRSLPGQERRNSEEAFDEFWRSLGDLDE